MIKDNRQRLFEMMNKVGGMPLNENILHEAESISNLPPGFSSKDFVPLTDDILNAPCQISTDEGYYISEDIYNVNEDMLSSIKNAVEFDPSVIQTEFKKKLIAYLQQTKQGIGALGRIHSGTLRDIIDLSNVIDRKTGKKINLSKLGKKKFGVEAEDLPEFDLEKLKDILMKKPDDNQLLGQNKKMAKTNFYNISLPALKSLIYHEASDKFYVTTVCGQAKECVAWCYAQIGNYLLFDPPVRLKMQKLNYIINHWEEWKSRVIDRIKYLEKSKKEGEEVVVRWHDSGDFMSEQYLGIALDIARETPNAIHYAYTKEVKMIKGAMQAGQVPPNFEFKFSLEGKQRSDIKPEDPRGLVLPSSEFSEFWKPKPEGLTPEEEKEWEKAGMWKFTSQEMEIVKQRAAKYYNIDADKTPILTHDEYVEGWNKGTLSQDRIYYVISKPGDTDLPASRKNTLGIINLLHK